MGFEPKFQGNARFEVRRQLGEGGMGAVYEVIDHERGARVALKVLSRMNPGNVEQFKNEFRGLADVMHPNLVSLHELVADGEHWMFTMELVEGVSFIEHVRSDEGVAAEVSSSDAATREQAVATIVGLGGVVPQAVRGGRLDETRLRPALAQLAAGVRAIHRTGKVHRDLKHSNVLVDPHGRVVILDFGLVADAALRSDTDAPGGVWGTPAYMAPEQAAGKVATAASDWYAVGVMLYEALTGRLPFAGKAQEVLIAKQRAEPVPPRCWVGNVPPDLEELSLQLMRFRPEERPSGDAILARLGVTATPQDRMPDAPSRARFVGRAREIEALTHALRRPLDRAQIALIEGLSGMGKSALADEVIARLRRAEPSLVVLSGRCYARESVPFKAFDGLIDALTQHLKRLPEQEVVAFLPVGAAALTQMFPALMQVPALTRFVRDELLPAEPKELRRRAFSCLRMLLDRVARAYPLLVYIDDLQWGDEDSARLWIELLADEQSPPLSWLCTFRSDEREHSPCLSALLGSDGITQNVALRVELASLSADEILTIAGELLPRETLAEAQRALTHESGGNPYFALELAHELRSRPFESTARSRPVSLEQALHQRVSRLPAPTQQLLRVVSVAARPLDQKTAFRAAGLGYEGLSSLTELQSAHLVRLLGSHNQLITAYHDRIRESVFDGLAALDVKHIHGALAAAFEQRGDADPELMTEHLIGAGELPRAARFAARAAEQAEHALAFGRAARLYRLALDHTTAGAQEREGWSVRLAESLVSAGRGADAARAYLDAAEVSAARGDELRRLGAEQLILSGHIDQGIAILSDVLRACGLVLPEPGQALSQTMILAAALRERGLQFEPTDVSNLPPQVALRLEVCWALALGFTGSEPERLMPVVLQHLIDALDAGAPYHVLRALCLFIGNGATATRPRSRTIAAALTTAEALMPVVNAPDTDGWVSTAKGMVNFLSRGDAALALPCFEQAERTFRQRCRGVSREIGMAQVGILACLFELGRIADYRERYPAYLKDAEERSDLYLTMYDRSYHAALHYLVADDPDRAWNEIDVAVKVWGRDSFDQCALFSLLSRLEVLLYRGGPAALAWERDHGPAFLGSILATGHYFRARFLSLRGRAAVVAALAGGEVQALLTQAEADLHELEQSELKMVPGLACALAASIHFARGSREDAVTELDKLAGMVGAEGDAMLVTCAKLQQARLASDEGAPQRAMAMRLLISAQGVRDVDRWVAMYIPILG